MQKTLPQTSGHPASLISHGAALLGGAIPVLIVAGLLYAAFFIKPSVQTIRSGLPTIEFRDLIFGVAMPEDNAIWAVGNHGKIIRSDDAGMTWTQQPSRISGHLQSIAAWSGEKAVAVGNSLAVLHTSDSGKTWSEASVPKGTDGANKLMRVRVLPGGHAGAVGEFGAVLVSGDYGTTWRSVSVGQDVSWNDIAPIDPQNAVVVGEFGRIQVTADGGDTWTQAASPVQSSLNSVYFRDSKNGVAVGTEGVIIVTKDGGATWELAPKLTDQHIFDVMWDGKRWVLTGDKGLLLVGTADAARWTDRSSATDSSWHTQTAARNGRYAMAGRGVSIIELPTENAHTGASK
jgi:photosystem II stability/assembly factor-like uncharacterized protein